MSDDNSIKPDRDEAGSAPATAVTRPDDRAAASGADPASGGSAPAGFENFAFASLVPKLALVVATLALLIAGATWWQYRQFYVDLDNTDEFLLDSIEGARANLRRLSDELEAVGQGFGRNTGDIDELREELARMPVEVRALERRIEALQGGRLDARDNWLQEQAEYYLVLANSELRLARRVGNALTALNLADEVLRELGDPAYVDVRAAIAAERQALRAITEPDLEGLALRLASLGETAAALPLRAGTPTTFGAGEEVLDDVEPGLGRLWAKTKAAVGSIVRVEKQDAPVGPLLTDEERRIVRRQVELEIALARSAVLGRRQQDLRASLVAADQLLNRDFERTAPAVSEVRRELAELMRVELAPPLPDISDSLMLLRAARGA